MHLNKEWLLYAAYTFTCLEDRTYSFFTSVVLESLGGMRFVSIGQFAESVIQMFLSGWLGRFIDSIPRKYAIITVVLFNNFSLFLSVICFIGSTLVPNFSLIFLYSSICFSAINRLFLNAEKSILSRDWIVKISDSNRLSQQNATLTSLDQLINVLAPIGIGALISFLGISKVLWIFIFGSLISLSLKSVFIYLTYQSNESLQYKRQLSWTMDSENSKSSLSSRKVQQQGVLRTYYSQKTLLASLGMALFYKTVMGFDNLAVGYAKSSSDLSIFTIGLLRSFGSLAGMIGVLSYTIMEKRIGLVKAGLVGMIVQQVSSLVAVSTIWMPGSPFFEHKSQGFSILIFLISIATARYGLWCLDLTITHSMQLHVPEADRNTVFGFHMALCQAFSMPKELLVIVFSDPSQFYLYILSSYFCVTAGQILFCIYARKANNK